MWFTIFLKPPDPQRGKVLPIPATRGVSRKSIPPLGVRGLFGTISANLAPQ